MKYPYFWRYANFLTTKCGVAGRKPLCRKLARFVQSFRYNTGLWRTGRETDDRIYRASIASRVENRFSDMPCNVVTLLLLLQGSEVLKKAACLCVCLLNVCPLAIWQSTCPPNFTVYVTCSRRSVPSDEYVNDFQLFGWRHFSHNRVYTDNCNGIWPWMHESDAQGEVCYLLLHCLLYAKMTFFATDFLHLQILRNFKYYTQTTAHFASTGNSNRCSE